MRRHIVGCLIALLFTGTVHAGILINLDEVGSDVVASSSGGSLDLSALSLWTTGTYDPALNPNQAVLMIGSTGSSDSYIINSGPQLGSTIGYFPADTSSGSPYGLGSQQVLHTPAGYTSGDTLGASSATWLNKSFTDFGITPGTYTYDWGSGATYDSVTVVAQAGGGGGGGSAVPEPSSVVLWSLGAAAFSAFGWRRKRKQTNAPV